MTYRLLTVQWECDRQKILEESQFRGRGRPWVPSRACWEFGHPSRNIKCIVGFKGASSEVWGRNGFGSHWHVDDI